ncbi:MAG: molybdenum cofactor biosynthesis protein MoaE [Glaciecola sp.]|jgi:molybdopterin synthase catalytic subunit
MIEIAVQTADFDLSTLHDKLCEHNTQDGAVVHFLGRVRDLNEQHTVHSLTLEHYPGMTEKYLLDIAQTAKQKWDVGRVVIIHRVGALAVSDNIVFVGVTSPHRQDAFCSCAWIMDKLKSTAPFWKCEARPHGAEWLRPV